MGLLLAGAVYAAPAAADEPKPGANCPPGAIDCDVYADGKKPPKPDKPGDNGKPGGGGGGEGGSPKCIARDGSGGTFEVPCYDEESGWFDASSSCYWRLLEPPPAANDPVWDGHAPGDGAVYNGQCPGQPLMGGLRWFQNPPPGYGGGPNLEALAQEAVTKMRLLGADIGIAPKQGGTGTVGVPVWVWNGPSPQTTGPTSASATALGVTVTATATVRDVVWNFGNGTTVSCPFPGTPYSPSFGLTPPRPASGQCGIAGYSRVGEYAVTATTTWAVHWVGGGQQGDLTTTRSAQAAVRIGELQVVGQ
ncbi:hypothetical protein [Streptomyces erythrochromogenes]|uniref:hypothetical protein n=1 Tax=Streptomyces erythrochromogenes TaxID=285574 RepID=UPI0038648B05|nr:hypothetical protein OG489_00200 [Streptomyces erythrochromogenes]WSR88326.1 hypothetical protein OG489_39760 [Streptomyces erythrochromogenes]